MNLINAKNTVQVEKHHFPFKSCCIPGILLIVNLDWSYLFLWTLQVQVLSELTEEVGSQTDVGLHWPTWTQDPIDSALHFWFSSRLVTWDKEVAWSCVTFFVVTGARHSRHGNRNLFKIIPLVAEITPCNWLCFSLLPNVCFLWFLVWFAEVCFSKQIKNNCDWWMTAWIV